MKRNYNCELRIIDNSPVAIVTKPFLDEAEIIGSEAYEKIVRLRNENPGMTVQVRTIAKNTKKVSYKGYDYDFMRDFITAREGENAKAVLDEFEKTIRLSKAYRGPYLFVRNWFFVKYPDALKNNEEDDAAEDAAM